MEEKSKAKLFDEIVSAFVFVINSLILFTAFSLIFWITYIYLVKQPT